jgi:multimeric flavodoxin WrbA
MLVFEDLFAPPSEADVAEYKPAEIDFAFKTFAPGKIKNIVVFDGGPRNEHYSKTTFMVSHFLKGAKNAGANVEYFKLKNHNIHNCTGCYTCWTKTPGTCIFKDDMTVLREKFRTADLIVFASPLYFFNVTGIMKTFMDRLLPLMKPYMITDENGVIKHPDRYPEKGEQGFVVFSAGGFPDVENNFDALKTMFRMFDLHSENARLAGEFFLTAAEVIVQPVYSKRTEEVKQICEKAGRQIVKEGKIDKELMQRLAFPWASLKRFSEQADAFWRSLDGRERYLTKIHRIEST